MHYLDTHTPYIPPLDYLTRPLGKLDISKLRFKRNMTLKFKTSKYFKNYEIEDLISIYDSAITYVDDQIKNFLQQLELIIDLKNTYILITADHGEAFFEHGQLDHGLQLYEELIHVPLIIIGPNLPSKNVDIPVSLINLAPTILDLIGIESPPDFLGHSLIQTINSDKQIWNMCFSEEGQKNKKEPILLEKGKIKLNLNHKKVSIRGKKWKYIFNEQGKDELYNLIEDPGEKNNLIDNEKSVAIELKLMIDEHLKKEREISNKRRKILNSIDKLKISGKF
jgi:arylsulfatase A-like enzyme